MRNEAFLMVYNFVSLPAWANARSMRCMAENVPKELPEQQRPCRAANSSTLSSGHLLWSESPQEPDTPTRGGAPCQSCARSPTRPA